jgi:tRNA pseudouridine55 synthase
MSSPMKKVNGFLLLDKPIGISSNRALQRAKGLLHAKKAGHTGSLDPLASGLLPICFGEATKFSQFLLDADKVYDVTGRLGIRTSTCDREGEVIAEKDPSHISREQLEAVLAQFVGEQQQVPSMYSALKHQGQPLYVLARQGIEVERKARQITIHRIEWLGGDLPDFQCRVHCSKGTYIRNLIEDIGEALGVGAHVTELRRISTGPYDAPQMVSLDQLGELDWSARGEYLLPIDSALPQMSPFALTETQAHQLTRGQKVMLEEFGQTEFPDEEAKLLRLYTPAQVFLGIGKLAADGQLAVKRLMAS